MKKHNVLVDISKYPVERKGGFLYDLKGNPICKDGTRFTEIALKSYFERSASIEESHSEQSHQECQASEVGQSEGWGEVVFAEQKGSFLGVEFKQAGVTITILLILSLATVIICAHPSGLLFIFSYLLVLFIHEYGHAQAYMNLGIDAKIYLHMNGGLTDGESLDEMSDRDSYYVSIMGPHYQILCAGVLTVLGVVLFLPGIIFCNIFQCLIQSPLKPAWFGENDADHMLELTKDVYTEDHLTLISRNYYLLVVNTLLFIFYHFWFYAENKKFIQSIFPL